MAAENSSSPDHVEIDASARALKARWANDSADKLAAIAADYDRWGLATEADALRRAARTNRIAAMMHDAVSKIVQA